MLLMSASMQTHAGDGVLKGSKWQPDGRASPVRTVIGKACLPPRLLCCLPALIHHLCLRQDVSSADYV